MLSLNWKSTVPLNLLHSVFESEIYRISLGSRGSRRGWTTLPPLEARLSLLWMRTSVPFVSCCNCPHFQHFFNTFSAVSISKSTDYLQFNCIPVFLILSPCLYTLVILGHPALLMPTLQPCDHLISLSFVGCPERTLHHAFLALMCAVATNQFQQCPWWIAFTCEVPNPNTLVTAEIPPQPGLHICSRLPQNDGNLTIEKCRDTELEVTIVIL